MKLIIQIPCYNEEETILQTLNDLPKSIDGIDQIEILIIDDGCTDKTVKIAKKFGIHHVVKIFPNKGLANAFSCGIDRCLAEGADIIINTDADNQYKGSDIPRLIQPILEHNAEMVIGDRQIDKIEEFSFIKKKLQKLGSSIVRKVSMTKVPDTTSGFRAYSKDAAMKINILSTFSYTLETIIQAGQKDIPIVSIPIETNKTERPSRLFKSNWMYIKRSSATIIRIYLTYQPLKFFFYSGMFTFFFSLILAIRYVSFMVIGEGKGHIQSVILAGILLLLSIILVLAGLLSDVIASNRKLLEKILFKQKSSDT